MRSMLLLDSRSYKKIIMLFLLFKLISFSVSKVSVLGAVESCWWVVRILCSMDHLWAGTTGAVLGVLITLQNSDKLHLGVVHGTAFSGDAL